MDTHPLQASSHHLTDFLIGAWWLLVGVIVWLDGFALPRVVLWGSAALVLWRIWLAYKDWRAGVRSPNDDTSA